MSTSPPPAARPAELAASIFLVIAALVLTGGIVRYRLVGAARALEGPLAETVLTPGERQEGVSYSGEAPLIFVDSTPAGAEVKIGGRSVGSTPYSSNLDCDGPTIAVELKKAGYLSATSQVACHAGTAHVAVTLKRKP